MESDETRWAIRRCRADADHYLGVIYAWIGKMMIVNNQIIIGLRTVDDVRISKLRLLSTLSISNLTITLSNVYPSSTVNPNFKPINDPTFTLTLNTLNRTQSPALLSFGSK